MLPRVALADSCAQDSGALAPLAKTSRFGVVCATRVPRVAVAHENG
jgi:hypothetical protein